MWLFRQYRSEKAILDRLGQVEDSLKRLTLDWEDIYERCRKLMGRVVKERARMETAEQAERGGPDAQPVSTELPNGPTGRLTERQKEFQQKILRRRAGMGGG